MPFTHVRALITEGRKRLSIVKIVSNGLPLPRFYGVAWLDWRGMYAICLPVPLNLVAACARGVWIFARHGFMNAPVFSRIGQTDAYYQGMKEGERRGYERARAITRYHESRNYEHSEKEFGNEPR
jgi:hypothetical protein